MVYENVLSGAFIYSLGAIAGKNSKPNEVLQDSINFFQQTPTDQKIGDLLANWGGKSFIVEFKRTIGQISAELSKEHKKLMTTELSKDEEMEELSRRCHFLGYGHYSELEDVITTDILFNSYVDVFSSKTENKNKNGMSFNKFIDALLNPDSDFGIVFKNEFDSYLNFLIENSEKSGTTSDSGQKSRKEIKGILTSVSSEGKIIFLEYSGYKNLMKQLSETINLSQHMLQQIESLKAKPKKSKKLNIGL